MKFDRRLENDVEIYCGRLRNEHKKQRRYILNNGKWKPLWDLPCVAVSCKSVNHIDLFHDFSKPVRKDTYDKIEELKNALLRCVANQGKIGDQSVFKDCHNQVGRCAEPHAAKNCMLKHSATHLQDLKFSNARDIRTGEPKNPCEICKHVFPFLK